METLIMHPENKEQLAALKAVAKALKVPFEKKELSEREKTIELYGKDLVEIVEQAEKSIKEGNVKVYDTSKSLGENIKIWENTI
ncbi:DUF2683 family protein [Pedobacter frigiditerrae]|uniref:DUF2683 family protein n=1 Tax=Pedobacter frigiditerrae TaxID=2530452 RepID=UPI00292D583F|nr:DUF2683 family protein [Pedobacter frigiditerrae]